MFGQDMGGGDGYTKRFVDFRYDGNDVKRVQNLVVNEGGAGIIVHLRVEILQYFKDSFQGYSSKDLRSSNFRSIFPFAVRGMALS